jgi:hypothetical protein
MQQFLFAGCANVWTEYDYTVEALKGGYTVDLFGINSLRTEGDFCHQGWDTEIPPKI